MTLSTTKRASTGKWELLLHCSILQVCRQLGTAVQKGRHLWFISKACALWSPTVTAQGTDSDLGDLAGALQDAPACSCGSSHCSGTFSSPLHQEGGVPAPQLLQLTNGSWSLMAFHTNTASVSACPCPRAQQDCSLGTVTPSSTPEGREPHESQRC